MSPACTPNPESKPPRPAARPWPRARSGLWRAEGGRPKVLVVEDSEVILAFARIVLESAGYSVAAQASPHDFIATLERERPDLVLMDVDLGTVAGDTLVKIARRYCAGRFQCPIVLFSDRRELELKELARGCGAAGYIRKSGHGDALVHAVRGFIWRDSRIVRTG